LRFKSSEEASRVAEIVRHSSSLLEEPLVPVEEFPVQVRLLITGRYAILQFYVLFWRIVVGLFIILVLESFGLFGLGIGILLGVAYIGIPIWTAFVKARRATQGWIRVQGRSIVVRTGMDWTPMFPKVIEWKSPKVIVLRGRTKYELSFPTAQDLSQTVTKIRTMFPQVQEVLSDTYKQSSS
jgi:hypothetical protein